MKRPNDISLDDVRESKPVLRPSGDEWVNSERGQRVLERVLAADRAATARGAAQRRRSGWSAGPRLVFGAAAALVILLAVVVTVVVLAGDGTNGRVASPGTSAPAAELVTNFDAVAGIMPLYFDTSSFDHVTPEDGPTPVDIAVALDLVSPEEVSGGSASSAMTQGDYALLLVKAFGRLLPHGSSAASIDPAATASAQGAISFLQSAGIILPEDGDFKAAEPLTKSVETRLLGRLREEFKSLLD
jgi:hypothetical protein